MKVRNRFPVALSFAIASVLIPISIVSRQGAQLGYGPAETKDWMLSVMLGEGQTRFGTDFSERAFLRVRIGMTHKQVLGVLGEPVERCFGGEPDKLWRYSEPTRGSANFHQRDIWFSTNGTVSSIVKQFYWD